MKRKNLKRKFNKNSFSPTKFLILSVILLLIVFEALFILKNEQKSYQSKSLEKHVAGESVGE